jgi:hypothetical protein
MRLHRQFWIALVALMFASVACGTSPGEGEKAEKGYELGTTILDALMEYYSDHGDYPDSLASLVPDYLDQIPTDPTIYRFEYHHGVGTFSLSFYYYGPGANTCTFILESHKWECSGYF